MKNLILLALVSIFAFGANFALAASNLLVEIAKISPANPTVDHKVQISSKIKNFGETDAKKFQFKTFIVDVDGKKLVEPGNIIKISLPETERSDSNDSKTVRVLKAGRERRVTITLNPKIPGKYNLLICADEGNEEVCAKTSVLVAPRTLSVDLTAKQLSGRKEAGGEWQQSITIATSSSAVLRAHAVGTARGRTTYHFWCDRSDTGTEITSGWNAQSSSSRDKKFNQRGTTCDFSKPGTYTAKVIVQRDGLAAEDRVVVTVK